MNSAAFGAHRRISVLALLLASAAVACQGDDTAIGVGDAAAMGGGGGQGGSTGTGGSAGKGGSAGTGGTAGPVTDGSVAASDGATEGGSPGPCPVTGAGSAHFQLYSFDAGDGGAADLAAWSTFNMGPIVDSTDDSLGESASNPGSLHATITYTGYATFPVLESYHATPLDLSCFGTMHISVKITSSVAYIPFITLYVTSGATPPGVGYFSGNLLNSDHIADGNWHDLSATLSGNKAAIQRIGFQLYPPATQPDGGPAVPPPVDIYIDNVWLE